MLDNNSIFVSKPLSIVKILLSLEFQIIKNDHLFFSFLSYLFRKLFDFEIHISLRFQKKIVENKYFNFLFSKKVFIREI